MSTPFFSVVIPTYNRLELLKITLKSIHDQKFNDFEVIVVDNFSTDGTADFMQSQTDKRIKYIRNESNRERSYSRNRGLEQAKGVYVTLLDSDDIMYKEGLKQAYAFISDHPGVKFFHCLYNIIDEKGLVVKARTLEPIRNAYRQICQGNFISCIGVFLHSDLAKKFKFSEDPKMIGSEDYEIWLRVMVEYQVLRLPIVICGMREHPNRSVYSSIYQNLEYQRDYLISVIEDDEMMNKKYKNYVHLLRANYNYHVAMYSFFLQEIIKGVRFTLYALSNDFAIIGTRRFLALGKNFMISLRRKIGAL